MIVEQRERNTCAEIKTIVFKIQEQREEHAKGRTCVAGKRTIIHTIVEQRV